MWRDTPRLRSGAAEVAIRYLAQRWLPSKKLSLRSSTYDSYRRNIELHITRDRQGTARRLRPDQSPRTALRELADHGRADGAGGFNPKTIVEIHMILRRSLDDVSAVITSGSRR